MQRKEQCQHSQSLAGLQGRLETPKSGQQQAKMLLLLLLLLPWAGKQVSKM